MDECCNVRHVRHVQIRVLLPLLARTHSIEPCHSLTVILNAPRNLEERDCAEGVALHSAACVEQQEIVRPRGCCLAGAKVRTCLSRKRYRSMESRVD